MRGSVRRQTLELGAVVEVALINGRSHSPELTNAVWAGEFNCVAVQAHADVDDLIVLHRQIVLSDALMPASAAEMDGGSTFGTDLTLMLGRASGALHDPPKMPSSMPPIACLHSTKAIAASMGMFIAVHLVLHRSSVLCGGMGAVGRQYLTQKGFCKATQLSSTARGRSL